MRTLASLSLLFALVCGPGFAGEKTKPTKGENQEPANYQLKYEREVSSLPLYLQQFPSRLEASVAPERPLVINTPLGGFWLFAPEPAQTAFDACRPTRSNYPTDPFSAR